MNQQTSSGHRPRPGLAPTAVLPQALGLVGRLLPQAGSARRAQGDDLRGTLPAVLEAALDRAGQRSNQ